MELHPATRGFEDAGERYERGRPDYPAAAIDWLLGELGRPGSVADVGAGTGKLTRPLLERGVHVIAVEPVAGMRATLARAAPGADVRAGQAEALPLDDGSVDAVVAGQAFHWFANATALGEFARVLRGAGRLGLIWNGRDREQPLQAALSRIVEPYRGGTPQHAGEKWRAAFTEDAPFALAAERKLPHSQALDADGLADRVLSISFVAALPPAEREGIDFQVRELAAGGTVELRYVTEVLVYARTA